MNKKLSTGLMPWAANLEDDVTNINGWGRDYLLTAWYWHDFRFDPQRALGMTVGTIDSSDDLDHNTYSNDEYTQFMNAALLDGRNGFLSGYDVGAALERNWEAWSLNGVWMNVGEKHDGKKYDFFRAQVAYNGDTRRGPGHYRLVLDTTSRQFLEPGGRNAHREPA